MITLFEYFTLNTDSFHGIIKVINTYPGHHDNVVLRKSIKITENGISDKDLKLLKDIKKEYKSNKFFIYLSIPHDKDWHPLVNKDFLDEISKKYSIKWYWSDEEIT